MWYLNILMDLSASRQQATFTYKYRWSVILVGKPEEVMERERGCRVHGQKSGEMFPLY